MQASSALVLHSGKLRIATGMEYQLRMSGNCNQCSVQAAFWRVGHTHIHTNTHPHTHTFLVNTSILDQPCLNQYFLPETLHHPSTTLPQLLKTLPVLTKFPTELLTKSRIKISPTRDGLAGTPHSAPFVTHASTQFLSVRGLNWATKLFKHPAVQILEQHLPYPGSASHNSWVPPAPFLTLYTPPQLHWERYHPEQRNFSNTPANQILDLPATTLHYPLPPSLPCTPQLHSVRDTTKLFQHPCY